MNPKISDIVEGNIVYRNARFRAWRDYGVPVNGFWEVYYSEGGVQEVFFEINCIECGVGVGGEVPWPLEFSRGSVEGNDLREYMENHEQIWLRHLLNPNEQNHCASHLAPLLGIDPPEVLNLIPLEILEKIE